MTALRSPDGQGAQIEHGQRAVPILLQQAWRTYAREADATAMPWIDAKVTTQKAHGRRVDNHSVAIGDSWLHVGPWRGHPPAPRRSRVMAGRGFERGNGVSLVGSSRSTLGGCRDVG